MKDKIIVIGFSLILSVFFFISILDSDILVSSTERRTLAFLPKFKTQDLLNGEFMEELDAYLLDQFPYRDIWRKGKNVFLNNIYQKNENHGAYVVDNGIYQIESVINEKSIDYFANKLNSIQETYFSSKNVYYAIIPDKNYYLDDGIIPKLEYSKFYSLVNSKLNSSFEEIDLKHALTLDSYYRTDLHWKQEELERVVNVLQESLNLSSTVFPTISEEIYPFYGAYYSKSSGTVLPDALIYLKSKMIDNTKVYNLEKNQIRTVYVEANLENIDKYDIFLDGATPVLVLENSNVDTGKELVLFRDSFGSSLVPLLLENYEKITVIDLRYYSSSLLSEIPEFDPNKEEQDILFLYSVPIINQSFTLK